MWFAAPSNFLHLSIFLTPISFRWTIPLRDFKTQPPEKSRYGPWDEESKMVKSATLVNFLVAQKEVLCFFIKKTIKANVNPLPHCRGPIGPPVF